MPSSEPTVTPALTPQPPQPAKQLDPLKSTQAVLRKKDYVTSEPAIQIPLF